MSSQPNKQVDDNQPHGGVEGGTRRALTGGGATRAPIIETFPNPQPGRDYIVQCECPEFTCLCPRTGQPDFATITVRYTPDELCFELKSWKLYLWSYRNEGSFHEAVTNQICDDLVAAIKPRWIEVIAHFTVRGGITTTVTATHGSHPK